MRTKKALMNTTAEILYEIVAVICGFILPRLILSTFGSSYNGITSSITQFVSCIVLLKSGIGGVTRAALYKPLSEKNNSEISGIIVATESYMRKIALLFSGILIVFAAVYPFLVSEDFEWLFSFTLFLIIGASTVVQYYFGMTYQMLLQADQKLYVNSLIQILTTILNTVVAAILIYCGGGIHIVKLGSSLVFMLNPLIINIYVRKNYNIDKNVKPNTKALSQRWDAFALQLANFVNNNTDLVVLTIFTNVRYVSVYTVYHLVYNGVKKIIPKIASGFEAALGNMLAKNESDKLTHGFTALETIVFAVSTIVFSCVFVLIVPFVRVYTKGITDANYIVPTFAVVSSVAEYFYCVRTPYQYIVQAAGKFRETRNGSFVEAGLNICISVILVQFYGLVGVAIGTLVAMLFRTIQYSIFSYHHIMHLSILGLGKRAVITIVCFSLVLVPAHFIDMSSIDNYLSWVIYGAGFFVYSTVVIGSLTWVFYRKDVAYIMNTVKKLLKHKSK